MNRINARIIVAIALLIFVYYAGLFLSHTSLFSPQGPTVAESTVTMAEEVVVEEPTKPAETELLQQPEQSADAVEPTKVEMPPMEIDSLFSKAQDALENKEWQQAITDFEQVSKMDTTFEDEQVATFLSQAYFNAGKEKLSSTENDSNQVEDALAFFRKATTLSPDNAEIRTAAELLTTYTVGLRAVRLGSFQQAVDILRPLYEESPSYMRGQIGNQLFDTYLEIGDRAMRKNNTQVAFDYFGRAQTIDVADPSPVENRLDSLDLVRVAMATPTPTATPIVTATATTSAPAVADAVAVVPEATPTPTTEPANCPDPRAVLMFPENGSVLSGFVSVFGTAINDDFWYYKLEFAPELSSDYKFIYRDEYEVPNGRLTYWNTTLVPDGTYKLRLVVVEPTGNFPEPCEVKVKIQNGEQSKG